MARVSFKIDSSQVSLLTKKSMFFFFFLVPVWAQLGDGGDWFCCSASGQGMMALEGHSES